MVDHDNVRDGGLTPEDRFARAVKGCIQACDVIKQSRHRGLYIDIGAFVGLTTIPLVKDFKRIVCFEMSKDNYECLAHNTEKYNNVASFNIGLSNQVTSAQIFEYTKVGSANCIVDTKIQKASCQRVEQPLHKVAHVLPLDYIMPFATAGAIKIDVEGHELQVIEGASKLLERSRGVAYIESIDLVTVRKVKKLMKSLGWTFISKNPEAPDDLIFKKAGI